MRDRATRKVPSCAPHCDADPGAVDCTDFDALFRDHHDFVWRTLRHWGVPPSALDDATQDVFVVVHRRAASFDGRAPLRNWLIGIARRVAASHRRLWWRWWSLRPEADEEPTLSAVADEVDLHDRIEQRELAALVQQFLDKLDPARREVFALMELEGMTAPEVADALGIKVNTVYSRLRSARRRFEAAMARHQARARRRSA